MRPTEREQRRGRRWWAAVTSVLAVLVVVVAGFVLGRSQGDGGGDPGKASSLPPTSSQTSLTTTASTSPSATNSSSAPITHQPPAGVLDVTALPTGDPPAIGYLQKGIAHLPDGTTVRPRTQYRPIGFTRLTDSTMVYLTQHGAALTVEVVTGDGTAHGPYRSGYELAVNADDTVVAWLSVRGIPTAWQVGLGAPERFPVAVPGNNRRLAAVTGTDCTNTIGCRVYASSWTGSGPEAWVATPDGTIARADTMGRLVALRDASESGLLVGYLRIADTGSTSAVIDEISSGHPLMWKTSRHTLVAFSPDLRYLLAGPAYRDGLGDSQIAIYSSAGRLLVQRQIPGRTPGFISGSAWEDATHVLFTVHQAGRWSIVRMSVNGGLEYAVRPVATPFGHGPFQLGVTP
jgi:hypothetical protein